MPIETVHADHYRIPLPAVLSDATHGEMSAFELVTVRVADAGEVRDPRSRVQVLEHAVAPRALPQASDLTGRIGNVAEFNRVARKSATMFAATEC